MSVCFKITLVALSSLLVRWCISLNSYSGHGKAPMFGDYEAQRHWQEITLNLPAREWYKNSSKNDLMYWGLDYPPLTAYHSLLCGYVAQKINPDWTALKTSRGYESYEHKLFMRYTVLVADILVFLPASLLLWLTHKHLNDDKKLMGILSLLLYPGLILIDYGHFQYNGMSLGLALMAVTCLARGHDLLGSVVFCLALNYKQMELYHALPFFFYLLGSCIQSAKYSPLKGALRLLLLGMVVVISFTLCWLPFLESRDSVLAVLQRLFPFGRGLYEDKVSNFWCSLSLIVKLKQLFDVQTLIYICLGTTAILHLPSSLHLMLNPSFHNFKLALINSSLIFFLFSFQVHEKSILLAAIPVALLVTEETRAALWFHIISVFSMMPLLVKDGLLTASVALTVLYTVAMFSIASPPQASGLAGSMSRLAMAVSVLGCLGLITASQVVEPPARLPDLHAVLISAFSCLHLLGFLVYFHWCQFSHSKTLAPVPAPTSGQKANSKKNK